MLKAGKVGRREERKEGRKEEREEGNLNPGPRVSYRPLLLLLVVSMRLMYWT